MLERSARVRIGHFLFWILLAFPVSAQDKVFTLQAPDELVETGFLKHILPRFSLKTGIRVTVTPETGDAAFGDDGTPAFRQDERIWQFRRSDHPHAAAFDEWLFSEVGQRTIDGFKGRVGDVFRADVAGSVEQSPVSFSGDVVAGEKISLATCGRCHVVSEVNRMNAIGSTPSFSLMRNFADWEDRFRSFYVLKPHPAFTQVAGVTAPFAKEFPSPIAPVELTLDELEAIVAYVASLTPADLGAPIQVQ
ncbi:MAG: cytochrome c [Pseudomonadota bacterium]